MTDLTNTERDILADVGFDDPSARAGTSILVDHDIRLADSQDDDVVIMPLAQALREFDFVQDLMFSQIAPDADEYVAQVAEHMHDPLGHFIWVRPGAKLTRPVQSFTILESPQGRQFTHDITLIDEGAEVEMISGNTVPDVVHRGRHVSVHETFLRKGARQRSVSIDHWGPDMEVRSYGCTSIGEGAHSESLTLGLASVGHHIDRSKTIVGENAIHIDQSIIFSPEGTNREVHTETHLTASGAKSEEITRMVSAGGRIVNNALLVGDAEGSSGFLGCDGLKLNNTGVIEAVPALRAIAEGAVLSHEASVGMIAQDKLDYLLAAGISEDAARDLIVQGFLRLGDSIVPQALKSRVMEMIAQAKSGGM
ncbi:MAG: hypothetical protein CSA70_12045 [Rhodobacterales bacterium]|nr:MAG: hypothetical protein CSA70_12045 [Rhodobacterales bacterium]